MRQEIEKEKTKKSVSPLSVIIALVLTLLLMFNIYKYYNDSTLTGKWVSNETGIVIKFTKDGTVSVDKKPLGKYEILDDNTLIYTIDNMDFEMEYTIRGNELLWGIKGEELESFKRKSI